MFYYVISPRVSIEDLKYQKTQKLINDAVCKSKSTIIDTDKFIHFTWKFELFVHQWQQFSLALNYQQAYIQPIKIVANTITETLMKEDNLQL